MSLKDSKHIRRDKKLNMSLNRSLNTSLTEQSHDAKIEFSEYSD